MTRYVGATSSRPSFEEITKNVGVDAHIDPKKEKNYKRADVGIGPYKNKILRGTIYMTSLFSYLITFIGGLFWLSRVIITYAYTMSKDIGIVPLDFNIEVILLFVTLICMILIIKRKIFGAIIYFIAYGLYFGTDLYNGILHILNGDTGILDYVSLFISLLGVTIPFLTMMDILLNKNRKGSTKDSKTDWFYTNEQYTRKHDERADENQYKF